MCLRLKSLRRHSLISIKLHVNAVLGAQQIRFDFTKSKESVHEVPMRCSAQRSERYASIGII